MKTARMIELDGSLGEGGGQVVRSALSLAALTGRPCHIRNLRARRRRPGLQPQHLMAVQAAAAICGATTEGARLDSAELYFEPAAVAAGDYRFDIGTAGCAPLVLQTVYLPLACASAAPSTVTITGGTHVPLSPTFHYLDLVWRPYLAAMGIELEVTLQRAGFYPPGGGELRALIQPAHPPQPLTRLVRGELLAIEGVSAVARLPSSIAERQRDQALRRLGALAPSVDIRLELLEAASPGTVLGLVARFEHGHAGFFSLGARGKPAERVADEAVDALFEHLTSAAVLDAHAGDQLLLPLALATGDSSLSVARITPHLLTQRDVIQAFLPTRLEVVGSAGQPGHVRIHPSGHERRARRPQRAPTPRWNVVVTVHEHGYRRAREALAGLGRLGHSDYHNVLVLQVDDRAAFLERLRGQLDADPELRAAISHVVPVERDFRFQSPAEFEAEAKRALRPLAARLAGKRFHVRVHRRGFRDRISARHEEHLLAEELLRQLEDAGAEATVDFQDPDDVVYVETLGQEGAVALCSREQQARYPFVKLL